MARRAIALRVSLALMASRFAAAWLIVMKNARDSSIRGAECLFRYA